MTKAELIKALEGFNDDDYIVVEVHDTVLNEDLYDFDLDFIETLNFKHEVMTEIRICPKQPKPIER